MLKTLKNALQFTVAITIIAIAIAAIWIFKTSPIFLGLLIVSGSTIVLCQGFVIVSAIAAFLSTIGNVLFSRWRNEKPIIIDESCNTAK